MHGQTIPSSKPPTYAQQYGQTAVLFHLAMKWGVDVDSPDGDGRTPLHWVSRRRPKGFDRDAVGRRRLAFAG
jgi:hypothetical protein